MVSAMKYVIAVITLNMLLITVMGQDTILQPDDSIPVDSVVNMLQPKVICKIIFKYKSSIYLNLLINF